MGKRKPNKRHSYFNQKAVKDFAIAGFERETEREREIEIGV